MKARLAMVWLVLLIWGCTGVERGSVERHEVTVGAASSMIDVLKKCEADFELLHSDIDVKLNFAASGTLLRQLEKGAPIEVFIFADRSTVDDGVAKKIVLHSLREVAANSLELVLSSRSKIDAVTLEELAAHTGLTISTGNPYFVPLGRYAKSALEERGIWVSVKDKLIFANSAGQARLYVERGEVDAAILFGSDVALLGEKVRRLERLNMAEQPVYVAGLTSGTPTEQARLFLDFLSSESVASNFEKFGFKKLSGADS